MTLPALSPADRLDALDYRASMLARLCAHDHGSRAECERLADEATARYAATLAERASDAGVSPFVAEAVRQMPTAPERLGVAEATRPRVVTVIRRSPGRSVRVRMEGHAARPAPSARPPSAAPSATTWRPAAPPAAASCGACSGARRCRPGAPLLLPASNGYAPRRLRAGHRPPHLCPPGPPPALRARPRRHDARRRAGARTPLRLARLPGARRARRRQPPPRRRPLPPPDGRRRPRGGVRRGGPVARRRRRPHRDVGRRSAAQEDAHTAAVEARDRAIAAGLPLLYGVLLLTAEDVLRAVRTAQTNA